MYKKYTISAVVAILILAALLTACSATSTTPARDVQVKSEERWTGSYTQDIEPVLKENCISCHNLQNAANGLNLETYEGVMKGTQYGRVVVPGLPEASTLVTVMRRSPSSAIHMPHDKPLLTENRMKNIELWIKAGATKD